MLQCLISLRSFATGAMAEARLGRGLLPAVAAAVGRGGPAAAVQAPCAQAMPACGFHASAAAGKNTQPLISLPVRNDNVDQALRTINKRVIQENLVKEWRDSTVYLKPAEQRVQRAKDTAKRLRKSDFKWRLRAVLSRKSRGF